MAAPASKPKADAGLRKPGPLVLIQQKLERVLHFRSGAISAYRTEVVSIVDTLDAINRDAVGLRQRGHLGDRDTD